MYKITVPFLGNHIKCSIHYNSQLPQLFKKPLINGNTSCKELMLTYEYLIKGFGGVTKVSKEMLCLRLALREALLVSLRDHANYSNSPSPINNAISWHLSVAKRILEKVKRYPANKLISLSKFKQWSDYFETNYKIFPSLIKRSEVPATTEIKNDRRTVLNIPQKPIASIQGFAEREYNKQKPYLLVGLMQ